MTPLRISPSDRVLAVAAHPDDIDIACGGSIRRWAKAGTSIFYCLATSGEKGDHVTLDSPAEHRVDEQHRAASILGVEGVEWLNERDGAVQDSPSLRTKLASVIRRVRPTIVLVHSPRMNLSSVRFSHPDHIAVGMATLAAIFPYARSAVLVDDGLDPWVVPRAIFFGDETPNVFVDIGNEVDDKVAAVSEHRSQLSGLPEDLRRFLVEWAEDLATRFRTRSQRIETFRTMDTA